MTAKRRDRAAEPLWPAARPRRGRVESALDKALTAAYADAVVSPTLDAGTVALARTLAAQLDVASGLLDPWAIARLSGEFRAVLAALRLDPTSRGALKRDEFAELLAELARPSTSSVDNPAQPG